MRKIILASKSPYRKQLLGRLGIKFETENSEFDEQPLKDKISDPVELTRQLSMAKAESVAKKFENALIIGSDQVCHIEGKILGKSGTLDKAFEQLKFLQGKTHELITSYAIIDTNTGQSVVNTNQTKLTMRKLSDSHIKNYLNADNPVDCAGAYKLELNGISLMEKIDTSDHTAIVGLPLIELANDLNKIGVQVPPEYEG
jgi:septum formation protein